MKTGIHISKDKRIPAFAGMAVKPAEFYKKIARHEEIMPL